MNINSAKRFLTCLKTQLNIQSDLLLNTSRIETTFEAQFLKHTAASVAIYLLFIRMHNKISLQFRNKLNQ